MACALITGASSGLGAAISVELAKRGYDLKLVARNRERLIQLKDELVVKYDVDVEVISLDLLDEKDLQMLILKTTQKVDVLINNAGIGYLGMFEAVELKKHQEVVQLNVTAVQILTHHFLKEFKEKDEGYILNIASTAAFSSGPLMASYYASKAYVLSLGDAIYEELKQSQSNVVMSTCCPGPIDTLFHQRANIKATRPMPSAETVAKCAIDGLFRGKNILIPGMDNRVLICLNHILPRWLTRRIVYQNQLKKY